MKASTATLVSDEDDEKENSGALDSSVDNKSIQGRLRVVNKGRRRESTILAGNLSYQVFCNKLSFFSILISKVLPPGECGDYNLGGNFSDQEAQGHQMHTRCHD